MSVRERKRPSYLEGDMLECDTDFNKILRDYQKNKPSKTPKSKPHVEEQAKIIPVAVEIIRNTSQGGGKSRLLKGKFHRAEPILTPQARLQEEIEEKHIARSRDRHNKTSKPMKVLPEGAVEIPDIKTAIKRGIKECSTLLLDWNASKAKMIGGLCKVYWDGENTWFYARILNYDSFYDRHYIYYLEDSTAEWISLEDEIVLVAEEMVLARLNPGGAPWAAQRYWISEKAKTVCHNFPGFHKGGHYIEYMTEAKNKEYAFLQRKCLDPMQDKYMPAKPSAAFKRSMKAAEHEQQDIDEVLEQVKSAIRDSIFNVLSGEQWVGSRVRASTHRIVQLGECRSEVLEQGSAYSAGVVRLFQPASGEHLVVFDDPLLQPQWVVCQKSCIDVLLGADETAHTTVTGGNGRNIDGSSSSSSGGEVGDGDGTAPTTEHWPHRHHNQPDSVDYSKQCACVLCEGELVRGSYKSCEKCALKCHTYCIPDDSNSDASRPQLWATSSNVPWTCWNCQVCFGCSASSWDKSLLAWNAQRVEPEGPDLDMSVCGECLYRYKHVKDFCPSCFKPYATDDSMLPLHGPVVVVPDAHVEVVTESDKSENIASDPEARQENGVVLKTEPMEVDTSEPAKEDSDAAAASLEGADEPSKSVAGSDAPGASKPDDLANAAVDSKDPYDFMSEDNMVECNECSRWVHANCEGIDKAQYDAMTLGTHPIWGAEYLCPLCRVKLSNSLIKKMQQQDQYGMFAEPVTEKVARNYYDVIRNPMDMATMSSKAKRGLYKSLQALRQDFELMCLNAMVFNSAGDEYWREARRFNDEVQNMFRLQKRKSHTSAYGFELSQLIEAYNAQVEAARVSKLVKKRKAPAPSVAAEERIGDEGTVETSSKRGRVGADNVAATTATAATSEIVSETNTEAGDTSPRTSAAPPLPGHSKSKAVPPPVEESASRVDPEVTLDDCVYLPDALVPSPDPSSFLPCTVVSQSVEEAYFLMCQDVCLVCGAAGRSEVMLFCVDCGEAVHTFCCDAPLSLMPDEARAQWRCMNCKFCTVCSTSAENDVSGKMLYCEGCDEAYHCNCLTPKLELMPENSWYCANCVSCTSCASEQNSASDRGTVGKCWGFERTSCYECLMLEQARQATAAEERRIYQMELARRNHPSNCNVCWDPCTEGFALCTACGRNSHLACNSAVALPLLKNGYECYRDFLCFLCSTEHLPSCVSHLGSGAQAAALLAMVSRIQRQRKQNALESQSRRLKVLEDERTALFESHRKLFRGVIFLAAMRIRWFDTFSWEINQIPPYQNLYKAANANYISARALRFLSVWRRYMGSSGSEHEQTRRNLALGLDGSGAEMSAERLVRMAALASAYLLATSADVRKFLSVETEIAPAVQFVLKLHQADPLVPITTEEESAIAAALTLQFLGYGSEAALPASPIVQAAPKGAATTIHVEPGRVSPIIAVLEGCIEKLVRLPIGLDGSDVPFTYAAGTHVFGADSRRQTVVVPWKPGNVIDGTNLLSRRAIPQVAQPSPTLSTHTMSVPSQTASGVAATVVEHVAEKRPIYPFAALADAATSDFRSGENFYARKAKLCSLVRRDDCVTAKSADVSVENLFRRHDVVTVAAAVDKARAIAVKEINARTSRQENMQNLTARLGPHHEELLAVMEDLIVKVEKRCRNLKPPKTSFAISQLVERSVVSEDAEIEMMCIPCDAFDPSEYTFAASPARPLNGWGAVEASERSWTDPRSCCLCFEANEDSVVGRLIPSFDGFFVHVNCLRWSPDVVESEGMLLNAVTGRERALKTSCFYCTRKGATVSCNKRKCRRAFHVRCAIKCKCAMLETKPASAPSDKAHDIQLLAFCTEHIPLIRELAKFESLWVPYDPLRTMLIVENQDANFTAELLAQRRSDKAVRAGALTVYNIGKPLPRSAHFHDNNYIYPHRFRSSRIYWSMVTPFERTLYSFEIFAESDFDHVDASKVEYIRSALERNDRALKATLGLLGDEWDSADRPIFRIVAVDNPTRPIFSHSLEQAFQLVAQGVCDCNQKYSSAFANCKLNRPRTVDSFGFSAYQFCGIGLPFVRKAIELLPESLGVMVSLNRYEPHALYAPVFKLPTKEGVALLQQQLLRAQEGTSASLNGCARADGFGQSEKRFVGKRITRILSKVADLSEGSGGGGGKAKTELNQYELREDEDENKRVNEALKARYREMTAAYLHNPYSKLDVRKSGIHGWGLFAKINFERNDIIVEYIGQKIRQVVADRREANYEEEGVGSCYLFRLDKEDIIDATRRGGMARFINHCCEPNAYARVIISNSRPVSHGGSGGTYTEDTFVEEKHIIIMAARDIQEGEEVTYDYKFPIEDSKLNCYCGASCCGGFMN